MNKLRYGRLLTTLLIWILGVAAERAQAGEKVAIQLKWKHQFQFAGYYAALEKGYYEDVGLDVEILEGGPGIDFIDQTLSGKAQYGVGMSDLLLRRAEGKPVVVLACIFQHSPLVLASLEKSGIRRPRDLAGRRVMMRKAGSADLFAMLKTEEVKPTDLTVIEHSFRLEDLIEGQVDAMSVYNTDQVLLLRQSGEAINILSPLSYGVDFYGDCLFTTEQEIGQHPDRVEAFRRASLKGWEYAMEHREELTRLIHGKYASKKTIQILLAEAEEMLPLMLHHVIRVGHTNPGRWERIRRIYVEQGMIDDSFPIGGLLYEPPASTGPGTLVLSNQERGWLREHPVVPILVDSEAFPYSFVDEQGDFAGILADVCKQAERALGIRFKHEPVAHAEIVAHVANGDRYVVSGFDPPGAGFEGSYLETRDIAFMPNGLFALRSSELHTQRAAAVHGKRVAIVSGWDLTHPSLEPLKPCTFVFGETSLDCLDMVARGEADAAYDDVLIVANLLKQNQTLHVKLVRVYNRGKSLEILVKKGWAPLHSALNKMLAELSRDDRKMLLGKWGAVVDDLGYRTLVFELTAEERTWLLEHPVIRVASDPDWAPLESRNVNGEFSGLAIDYLKLVERQLGVRFEIDAGSTWDQLIQMGKARKIDLFSCVTSTPEREAFLDFTPPYISFPIKVFVRDDASFIGNLRELHGKRVAVVGGYAVEDMLRNDHPEIQLVRADTIKDGLRRVERREVVAFVGNFLTTGTTIRDEGITSMKIGGDTPYSNDLGMGGRNDWPELNRILKKSLGLIPQSSRDRIYQQWIPMMRDAPQDYSLIWKAGLPLFALLLAFVAWNWQLKRRVARQVAGITRSENALRKLIAATSGVDKESYFKNMALALREVTDSTYTFIGQVMPENRVVTIAVAKGDELLDGFEYSLVDTPCAEVLGKDTCLYKDGVAILFPDDQLLLDMGIEAYLGTPIWHHQDECIGIVVSLYDHSIQDTTLYQSIFETFAVSIGSEMVRHQAESSLRESEEKNRTLLCNVPGTVYRAKPDWTAEMISSPENITGYSTEEFASGKLNWGEIIHGDDCAIVFEEAKVIEKSPMSIVQEYRIVTKDQDIRWVSDRKTSRHSEEEGFLGIDGIVYDITARKQLEDRLRQAEKMQAVGQLAGGVAHDFNNMLSAIMSGAELLRSPKRELGEKALEYVDIIYRSAARAADLTAKLLAFGRKSHGDFVTVDLNSVLNDLVAILTNTIDKRISIVLNQGVLQPLIRGNPSAVQNVLMNLAINASHAMPDGGEIRISVVKTTFNQAYCQASPFEIKPGRYIDIECRDTGCGIPAENLNRIFEPFFTTKEQGKGTGLGLAAAYGTIQDHHGAITVNSEVEVGTVFHVYLPCTAELGLPDEEERGRVVGGQGCILLVDDEEHIRMMGRDLLEEMGYRVVVATDGVKAVEAFRQQHEQLDLVILDMVMPKMNGEETFLRMRQIDENCKVILASGFTKDSSLSELRQAGLAGFIQKPYRRDELGEMIEKVLGGQE